MPFPNFHACRIRDPGDFQDGTFRTSQRQADGKPVELILGKLKGETTMTLQSFRYPKDKWTVSEAKAH